MKKAAQHDPILECKDIWLQYPGGGEILKGVSLQIFPGVVTMILGRSGSGKTTLLKILAHLLKPNKGSVEKSPLDQSGGMPHIAYIPQSLGLVRHLTALENTLLGALKDVSPIASLFNVFPSDKIEKAKTILTDLGLKNKQHQGVGQLSGGERQRVAIARALMQNPQIILADEFVSQLDALTTREILAMTKSLTKQNISVLISTHDIDLVKEYADRVIIMGHGKVIFDSPAHCLTPEQMLSYFL